MKNEYNFDLYMRPIWNGNTMYNETLMFVQDENGVIPQAPLLYKPVEILSVCSFDLKTEYEEGKDYIVQDGNIILTDNTSIKYWKYNEYYPETLENAFKKEGGGFIAFGEGAYFFKTQAAVTYTHNGTWNGPVPKTCENELKRTIYKLQNNKELKIVYAGDSITTGANSSKVSNEPPFAPMWTELVTQKLADFYKNENVTEVNTAVGGKDSTWGLENVQELVTDYNPDLAVIAFGMNDIRKSPEEFRDKIEGMVKSVRAKNADADIILVSSMVPNREVANFYGNQYLFEDVLNNIAKRWEGIAVAPVWSMHEYLLTKKRYYDMTGNNVNHPNDFLARIYAQTVSSLVVKGE